MRITQAGRRAMEPLRDRDRKYGKYRNNGVGIGGLRRVVGVALVVLGLVVMSGCATVRPPKGVSPVAVTMVATGYCKCKKCCNWKRNWYFKPVIASGGSKGQTKAVGKTASGTKGKPGTIAADTSRYPFGTVMYVPGYGYGRVEDRGGAIVGDRIDLFFKSHKEALRWGKQTVSVQVWK